MELTPFAQWLNTAFADFDRAILSFYHGLAESAGGFFTPISIFFARIGDLGIFCFALAILLMFFKKTRKTGFAIVFSVLIGSLFTNVTIKELVARPRPFAMEYKEWWEFIGSPKQGEYSFPSGHVTSAMAGMTAVCLTQSKKWIAPALSYAIIMGATRNYLMVHYPSDVIGGLIVGAVAGILAVLLANLIFKALEKNNQNKVCNFLLEADVRNIRKKSV